MCYKSYKILLVDTQNNPVHAFKSEPLVLDFTKGCLYGCSTGANPTTDSTTLGSVRKVEDKNLEKKCTKNWGRFHLPDRIHLISSCMDQDPDMTWGQGVLSNDKTGNYQGQP